MGFWKNGRFVEESYSPDDQFSRRKASLDIAYEVSRIKEGKTTALAAMRRLLKDHRVLRKDKRRAEKHHMLSEVLEYYVAETLQVPPRT